MEHFQVLLKDMNVIFTQSKYVLREHRFLLGRQPLGQDHTKMGHVEVFIRAIAFFEEPECMELLLSSIFALMFLPINASRESYGFYGQSEIDGCMKRREEILKALKDIVKYVSESTLITEIALLLELSEQLASVGQKSLILDICKNISVIGFEELKKLEALIKRILIQHSELKQKALEAWAWAAFKYFEIVNCDILDERIDISVLQSAISRFFKHCSKDDPDIAINTLEKIYCGTETNEFLVAISYQVLIDIWEQEKFEAVIGFLHSNSSTDISNFGRIYERIASDIQKYNLVSVRIISILAKFSTNSPVYNCLLPSVLQVFRLRKQEFTQEEITFITEAIKVLMTAFIKNANKSQIASGIVPLFLCLFHKSYPVLVTKAVSKALCYISNTCKNEFADMISRLEEREKKFIESQLAANSVSTTNTSAQPTITLSLKFKKN